MGKVKPVAAGRPRLIGNELRRRLFVLHYEEGYTLKQVCELNKYMLKSRTVYRLFAEFSMNLDWRLDPPVQKDRSDSARDALLTALRTIVDANPSLFLDEIQAKLRMDFKLKVSVSSVCRYLHRAAPAGLGYTLQVLERRALQKDYIERSNFLRIIDSGLYPSAQMIFVDETHKSESLPPLPTHPSHVVVESDTDEKSL